MPGRLSSLSGTARVERSALEVTVVQGQPFRPAATRPGCTLQRPAGSRRRASGPRSPSGGKAPRHAVRAFARSVDLALQLDIHLLTLSLLPHSARRDVILHRRLARRWLGHSRPLNLCLHPDRRLRCPRRDAPCRPPPADPPLPQQRHAPTARRLQHGLPLARTPLDRLRARHHRPSKQLANGLARRTSAARSTCCSWCDVRLGQRPLSRWRWDGPERARARARRRVRA